MKLTTVAFVLLLLLSLTATAQTDDFPNGSLYARAVSVCMTKEKADYGKQTPSASIDYSHRIFVSTPGITDGLPTLYGDIAVDFLTYDGLRNRFPKLKGDVMVTEMGPLSSDGQTMKISLRDSHFSYRKNATILAVDGGCVVTFIYACEVKRFEISDIKLWGV